MVCAAASANWGMAQADAAQRIDEHIGHGREPHAELIGLHGGRGCSLSEQLELFTDAVLSLAAGAIEILVEGARGVAAVFEPT